MTELNNLKTRFKETMKEVSDIVSIPMSELTREEYIRITVDCGIEGRLNKEELNVLGGFSFLKEVICQTKEFKRKEKERLKAQEENATKSFIIETVIEKSQTSGYLPTINNLKEMGITKKMIKDFFGDYRTMLGEAEEVHGGVLSEYVTEEYYCAETKRQIRENLKGYNKFIITSVVSGKPVDSDFLRSLENLAVRSNAAIVVLPCEDIAKRNKEFQLEVHQPLTKHNLMLDDFYLNDKIHLSSILVSAKQIHPLTGLDRLAQKKGSMILASPKQDLKFVANSNKKLPKALMTAGAVTVPDYFDDYYMSKRTSYLAEFDHVLGAVIVEIEDDDIYHFRQLQSGDNGEVIDLGIQYNPDQSTEEVSSIAIFGDTHVGSHDIGVNEELIKLTNEVRSNEVIFHDIFDCRFNNHHDKGKFITRAKLAEAGKIGLKEEGKLVADFLTDWGKRTDKMTIVKSNHDEALDRYLNECRWLNDPTNFRLGLKLSDKMMDGTDPLKYLIEEIIGVECADQINWLERDEDYKVFKSELSSHGDLGSNGSRGSLKTIEKAFHSAIVGHSHTAGILRGVKQVGTSSLLKLGYNRGPSSWTQTCCIEYPNGTFQLINFIKKDGKVIWRT